MAHCALAQLPPPPVIPAEWKPYAQSPYYSGNSWGTAANWGSNTTGYDNVGSSVKINVNRYADPTITLDGNRTVGTMQVGNSTYLSGPLTTIAQGTAGAVIFDASAGNSASLNIGSSSLTIAAPVLLNDSVSVEGTGTLTLQQTVSGTGGLNIGLVSSSYSQVGSTVLTANNTFTGGVSLWGGSLSVGNGGTAGTVGTGSIYNDGVIVLNRSNDFTFSNAITGGGAVVKLNTNTVTLTGNSSYAQYPSTSYAHGAYTDIEAGTLQVGNGGTSGQLGNAPIYIKQGATLAINHSDAVTLYQDISGAGSLVNIGTGSLNLKGNTTVSGPTVVSSGRLANNGALASNIVVSAGGTFGGNGTTEGSLSIANGGILAPGNSIGTVTIKGNSSFAAGAHYSVEIGNAQAHTVAGVDNDFLNVSGSLSLPNGAFNVDVVGYGPGQTLPNFDQTLDYNWTIATAGLGILGFNNTLFQLNLSGLSTPYSGSWFMSQIGDSLLLNYSASGAVPLALTPVPEATTITLAPLAAIAVALVRFRHSHAKDRGRAERSRPAAG